MICLKCLETGIEVEMEHVESSIHFHDPSDPTGHGEMKFCWYECNTGHEQECEGGHLEDIESEIE